MVVEFRGAGLGVDMPFINGKGKMVLMGKRSVPTQLTRNHLVDCYLSCC